MNENTINIRLMEADDFDAVVAIDEKVLKVSRPEYYEIKFDKYFKTSNFVPVSFVAVAKDGMVAGFIMGEIYIGEFGISQEGATLDTIGVDPDYQQQGIGEKLINEFAKHLRSLSVEKLHTLVDSNDDKLIHFFKENHFSPSKIINLERSL